MEKIAALAPMPSASVNTATAVKPGFFASVRIPNRMSCQSSPISCPLVFQQAYIQIIDAAKMNL